MRVRLLPARSRLVLTSLVLTAPIGLAARQARIPPHPRALQMPETQVTLPTAADRRFVLDSGPVVYLVEDHTLPLVEISLALRIGSFLDPPDRAGLAYLTGALLRRGGGGELSADRFDERVDELGARLSSVSGATRGGASASVPSWNWQPALDLFFEMLAAPRFDSDRLAAVRSNLHESLLRRNQDPLQVAQREWEWLLYDRRHFSTRPLTAASLDAIEREDLISFHRRYWRPEGMILAVSGDFEPDRLLTALEEHFSSWPQSAGGPASAVWPPADPPGSAAPGLYHSPVDVPQAKVMLGHRLPELLDWQDPERFSLAVLAEILGGREGVSRLVGRLRTSEGLVYRASLRLEPGQLWPGELQIFFDTGSESVARAVAATLEELERLRSAPVQAEELETVKRSLLARLRLAFDTAEEVVGTFAEDELLDRPHAYWQSYLQGIEAVSTEGVRAAARRYLRPERTLCLVVGRWAEIAGDSAPGESALERALGQRVRHLPKRDPLSLEPVTALPAPPSGGEP